LLFNVSEAIFQLYHGKKKKKKRLVIFAAVASWTPKNNNFSSLEIILEAQQRTLHMKYSKFK